MPKNIQKNRRRSFPMMTTAPFMAVAINGVSAIRISTARTFVLAVQATLQTLTLLNAPIDLLSIMVSPLKSKSTLTKGEPPQAKTNPILAAR